MLRCAVSRPLSWRAEQKNAKQNGGAAKSTRFREAVYFHQHFEILIAFILFANFVRFASFPSFCARWPHFAAASAGKHDESARRAQSKL